MNRLCYPWETTGFKDSQFALEYLWSHLMRVGYPDSVKIKPKNKDVLTYTSRLGKLMLEYLEFWQAKREHPTLSPMNFIVCPNLEVLQTLANTLPVTIALSSQHAVFTVTTRQLIELMIAQKGEAAAGFEFDEADRVLEELESTGLLVWNEVGVKSMGATKFEGGFSQLLTRRLSSRRPTLLFLYFPNFKQDKLGRHEIAAITKTLKSNFGETISSIMTTHADFIYTPAKTRAVQVRKL